MSMDRRIGVIRLEKRQTEDTKDLKLWRVMIIYDISQKKIAEQCHDRKQSYTFPWNQVRISRNNRFRKPLLLCETIFSSFRVLCSWQVVRISTQWMGSWSRPSGNCWINFVRLSFLSPAATIFFSWPFPAISEICSFRWHESTLKHRPGPHGSSGGRRSFSHRKWRNPFVIFEADIWNRETEQQTDCQGLLKLSVKKNIVALGDFISDPSPCLYHSLSRVVEVF